MKKNNVMTVALVVGGIGVAYWYLTRYGPNGPAYNNVGQQVAPTWWDTWFGGSTQAVVQQQPPTNTGTNVTQTPAGTTTPPPSTTVDIRTRLLTAAGGVTSLNADQWNYYRNQLFPPETTGAQFSTAFQRTDPMPMMSVDQFLAALVAAGVNPANPGAALSGLRGVIPVPAVPPIPSMSFGGSLATARPRIASPSVFRNRPVGGGGYIQ